MNQIKSPKKMELNNLPHLYTQYPWSPVPDHAEDFLGREIELRAFWYEMVKLVRSGYGTRTNYAFVGQRKLGKTAYLKRCYNIAFWEQNEAVPFYYSFPQNEGEDNAHVLQMKNLQRTMPLIFLRQLFAFYSKDKRFLELDKIKDILGYVKKAKLEKADRIIQCVNACLEKISDSEDIGMIENIWEMTQSLSFIIDKKCFLIIDEAQEMEVSVFNGKELRPCKASISDIIQKEHSLVFVSGSNVSMLVNNFLDSSFANRFSKTDFSPLEYKDAQKLIEKRCPNGYKNLQTDLLKLVGGNPYYINRILGFNMKYVKECKEEKYFSSKQGLQKAYEFEVLHPKGEIYYFWQMHLRKNKNDLNGDPKGKKGLALQLLYKVSKNPYKEFTYEELMQEFGVDEETLEKKKEQLENANLIEPTGIGRFAHAFPDKVLPTIINRIYHQLIIDGPSKSVAQEALEDHINLIDSCKKDVDNFHKELEKANKRFNAIKNKFLGMTFELIRLDEDVKAAQGKMNLSKGMKKENRVRKKVRMMIEKQQHIFADCELEGEVHSINIRGSKGTGCEIDVFAKLRKKNKEPFALLAEVKKIQSKVGLPAAKKFISSVKQAQQSYDLKDIVTAYISVSGFTKDAEEYLERYDVKMARSEKIFIE